MIQLRNFNQSVPCVPGECLKYVQDGFGIPARYAGAIIDWNRNTNNHSDYNFPAGCVVPIYFSGTGNNIIKEWGHVAALMPDRSVYSCSSPTSNQAIHYASVDALVADYARVGITLHYLGWSEDVEEVRVVGEDMSTVTLDIARIEAFFVGGRNGLDGKQNALNGDCDDELKKNHVGRETNADIIAWYRSSERITSLNDFIKLSQKASQLDATKAQLDALQKQMQSMPQDTSDAEKRLQTIRDALGIK